jgi:uncharacterized protein YdeI (YjbR/CyaY-like superfamily)
MGNRRPRDRVLAFADAAGWDAWLAAHHDDPGGVLLTLGKPGGAPSPSYAAALDVALAWGWIDGQKRALDERAWLQRFTRRRSRSPWSKRNRARAEALLRAGAMHPPGVAEVERARADGRWDAAYDSAATSGVPDDLAAALAADRRAHAFFDQLDAANRYAVLYRVQTAKRPETRARRIATFVAMLARHETLHPPRRRATARAPSRGG